MRVGRRLYICHGNARPGGVLCAGQGIPAVCFGGRAPAQLVLQVKRFRAAGGSRGIVEHSNVFACNRTVYPSVGNGEIIAGNLVFVGAVYHTVCLRVYVYAAAAQIYKYRAGGAAFVNHNAAVVAQVLALADKIIMEFVDCGNIGSLPRGIARLSHFVAGIAPGTREEQGGRVGARSDDCPGQHNIGIGNKLVIGKNIVRFCPEDGLVRAEIEYIAGCRRARGVSVQDV